jgi:hypothetical protein
MPFFLFGSKKSANNNTNNTNSDAVSGFQFDPFHDVNNNDTIDEDKRFSIVNLEKDVNEYMNYRSKYYFYNKKLKKPFIIRRRTYKKKEKQYYNLYIKKMKYLEETYRRTNNYTKYHAQLEKLPSANVIDDGFGFNNLNENTNQNGGINQNCGTIFG